MTKTRPSTTPAACTWADKLAALHLALRVPSEVLCPPPADAPLPVLVEVWKAWTAPYSGDQDPVSRTAQRWAPRFGDRDAGGEAVAAMLRDVQRAVAQALAEGQEHPEVLSTARVMTRTVLSHFTNLDGTPVPLAAGRFSDVGDRLQGAGLRPEDCPVFDGQAHLILGPLDRNNRPLPFYLAGEAITLTKLVKLRQIQAAAEQAEADRIEELNRRRRLEADETVQLKRKLQRLARLEAAGLIPADPPPAEPAVRGHAPTPTPARRE
jgi:hypothetical protein